MLFSIFLFPEIRIGKYAWNLHTPVPFVYPCAKCTPLCKLTIANPEWGNAQGCANSLTENMSLIDIQVHICANAQVCAKFLP